MTRQRQITITLDSPVPDIEPKNFYQTPSLMAMKAIRAKLTAADWSLWSYLQMIDPFGDYMVELPQMVDIARVIGVSERQVRRSFRKLEDLELYRWEPLVIRGQNLAGKLAREFGQNKKTTAASDKTSNYSHQIKMTDLSKGGQNCPSDDEIVPNMTKLSATGRNCPNREPEPLLDKGSKTSHTYLDFKNTLSEEERESFLNFCRKEVENYRNKIVHLEAWLASIDDKTGIKRWEEFYARYKATLIARSKHEKEYEEERSAWAKWKEELRQEKESAHLSQSKINQEEPVVKNQGESSDSKKSSHQIEDSDMDTAIPQQHSQEIKDTESQKNQAESQDKKTCSSRDYQFPNLEKSPVYECSKNLEQVKNASVRNSVDTQFRRNSYFDRLSRSA